MSTPANDAAVIRTWITHQQYGSGVPAMSPPVAALFEQIAALTTEQQVELWTRMTVPYCTRAADARRLLAPLSGENPSALSCLRDTIPMVVGPEDEEED